MTELTMAERSTIHAVVDGMQRRTRKRRKAARQGWALLLSCAMSLPIIASAFDGMISLETALMRIGIALALTTAILGMAGSLFDSYQADAATRTVENAVQEARSEAKAAERNPGSASSSAPSAAANTPTEPAGSNDGGDDDQ